MTFSSDAIEAMRQVRDDIANLDGFPPGVGGVVSRALETLKMEGASPATISLAERLSVCIFRAEMASWSRGSAILDGVRAEIASLALPSRESGFLSDEAIAA